MCLFSKTIPNPFQTEKFYKYIYLPSPETFNYQTYQSQNEHEKAKKRYIQKAYNTANKYITPTEKLCIANSSAIYYSQAIYCSLNPMLNDLKLYCITNRKEPLFQRTIEFINNSQKTFLKLFEKELSSNFDYYTLYDFEYFLTFENIYSAILEMEKDLNDHCNTFFNYAYNEYSTYTKQIETLFLSFGTTFTDFKQTNISK